MQEIQAIVNAQVKQMSESGEIQKQVEEGVKSAINKAIDRQFESYGNITKQLEDAFKENLLLDNRSLNIPSLNAVMTEVVNTNVNEFYKGQATERLHSLMKEKLAPLPSTMKLSEFVDLICKEYKVEDYESFDEVDEYATVEFSKSNYSWFELKIWKQKDNSYGRSNSADLQLTISKEGTLQGRHGSTNPYYLFDVDALIFKAYSQGVIFTDVENFDSDDCDLSLKDSEY
tara:strand:- start:3277 stop:3966 length:690 start_codon:yes stop_codon:yes gene_type:complete